MVLKKNCQAQEDLEYISLPYIIENHQTILQKRHVRVADRPNNDSQRVYSKLKTETNTKN